ncbi:MAG: serine/threonine-protein kinase [bacterium]
MAQQRYHVIERIDAGGMAEVFKANSTSLQGFEKLVAIKRILPELTRNERFVRMFLDEAKVSLHLNHTNCVQVFDLGLADGTYFIVMEYVDGTNLKNIIEHLKTNRQNLGVEEAAFIALEICKGLAHAHNKKDQEKHHLAIVHRDISPPNVLISVEGEVKITDFGLAKAKSQVETTDPGIVKGKFGYLSPEAAFGEQVDARTDVFAVGIMLWEMLTGERLFLGETDLATLQLVRKNETPPLSKYRSDVPPAFEAIIRRALESDLTKRFQTAEELGTAIAEFMFAYGKPITNFQIARFVKMVRQQTGAKERTEKDRAVEEAIQQAVNRIVSLEEVDDLDLYLAETYGQIETSEGVWDGDGDFGRFRDWADFGMDDVSVRESPH